MTMISAYLRAEEIDPSESVSFYILGRFRGSSRRSHISQPTVEDAPEFYRMLKELSDELTVEALENQDFPE